MADKPNTITCTQCQYVNEGQRVYCHNCGTKLDRVLLPTDNKKEESLEKKQKRIRKAVMPSRGFYAGFGKTFIATIFWAALIAASIQIARPPDDVPKKVAADALLDVRPVAMDLEQADEAAAPQKIILTEAEINGFLQNSLKSKPSDLIGDSVKFERAFVNLDEGMIRITNEQSIFDYPIYACVYYNLTIKDKKLVATCQGGHLGRLMIHPKIMMYSDLLFQQLWGALNRENKLLNQFQSIEVHKGHIDIVSKPHA
jgi:hypothetical protein